MFAALQVWHSRAERMLAPQGSQFPIMSGKPHCYWHTLFRNWMVGLPPTAAIVSQSPRCRAWQSPVCSWSVLGSAGPLTNQVLSLYSEYTSSGLCDYYYTLRSRPAPSRYPLAPCTCFQCIGVCRSAPVPRCQFRCVSLHTPSLSVLRCCIYFFKQLVVRNSFET